MCFIKGVVRSRVMIFLTIKGFKYCRCLISQYSVESGYSSSDPWTKKSPSVAYCNGLTEKCSFKK